ncbi:MAG: ABC transporter substrate-binding protein [Acetobacteraceae bacterium]|nr:ABC transporter substrate-binding protein [Acetobacteraceae bacterium]
MTIARRALLASAASALAAKAGSSQTLPRLRLGVLRFGTVSWELDVIRRHGLDTAAGIMIAPVPLAGSQATQVAMQAGNVDITAQDWLWVARQRAVGADWTFVPFSNATGAVIVPADSPIHSLPDLRGRRLGVAGSPIDKSWLILRAYAMRRFGFDPDRATQKSFGAPPLLAQELAAGRLDAVLTFWPFAAKAEAHGMRRVLAVEEAVEGLGIKAAVPVVGYVFSEAWARAHRNLLQGFLTAAAKAQSILASSDAEWDALRPLTGAANDAELAALRDYYRRGIPRRFGPEEQHAAETLFAVLVNIGGEALVGPAKTIPSGTFWLAAST